MAKKEKKTGRITRYDKIMSDFVRDLCNRSGLSQEEFAGEIGISKSLISMMHSGARSWTMATVEKIEDRFGIGPVELLGGAKISEEDVALLRAVKERIGVEEAKSKIKKTLSGANK